MINGVEGSQKQKYVVIRVVIFHLERFPLLFELIIEEKVEKGQKEGMTYFLSTCTLARLSSQSSLIIRRTGNENAE